jgi:coenzyme F420 hydrogenase subunit beta
MSKTPETIEEVVRSGLCTGCGMCESIAGREQVEMGLGINGHMRPLVRKQLPLAVQNRVMQVCPGANLEGPGTPADTKIEPLWGPVRSVDRSWAADEEVRLHGAGGGTLTALAGYLLDSGEVSAILHVKADPERPWLTVSTVSRSSSDLHAAAQSRYGPSSPLVNAHALLDEGVRFAVIAKPCDVSAVRSLMKRDERAAKQIAYLLTIFCGGTHHARVPKAIMRFHGVEEKDVAVFRYRGDGWPGPLRVETKEGKAHDMTYQGAWVDRPWKYDMQFRCKICVDAVGEVADISVPDGWVMRDGKPQFDEAPGTNIAITRTDAGVALLDAARKAGYLTLAPMTVDELAPMHVNHISRRVGGSAQLFALKVLQKPVYRATDFNERFTFSWRNVRYAWGQFRGTIRRVRAGENVEPTI